MALAATMEAGKLVIAGWLAAHWRGVGWSLRAVMVSLVAGLALINAAGVFGKLVEAHVSERLRRVPMSSNESKRSTPAPRRNRPSSPTSIVALRRSTAPWMNSTRRGRVTRALDIATQQRVTRNDLDTQRQAATTTLVGLQAQRAALVGERTRIEASAGPIQYLAMRPAPHPKLRFDG